MAGAYGAACRARSLCGAFYDALSGAPEPAAFHSRFEHAVNLSTRHGLFTVLRAKELFPHSATIDGTCELFGGAYDTNASFTVCRSGIALRGNPLVSFAEANHTDLRAMQVMEGAATSAFDAAALSIRNFLAEERAQEGLSALANEAGPLGASPYAAFLKPRLEAFRGAARAFDGDSAVYAAKRCAGLGIGLTPSSDDLLCGYFAVQNAAFPAPWVAEAARAAAESTSYLSAAFLRRAGLGLVSEATLKLFKVIARGGVPEKTLLSTIANYGASSGRDYLTGLYFGFSDIALRRKKGRERLASNGTA
ncbi:MAG: DUF2877 domain-containing protein [Eubacteriales bacterium]|nr:DUF2877 domain-containing protein [Eubacteriales bacterium]